MVSAALVLLTLSTLAVHGKEMSTDGPIIPPGCEGETLCDIKPADYPQEEIDSYLINNPDFHKRLKREFLGKNLNAVSLAEGSTKGNCKTNVTFTTPYQKVTDPSKLPRVIVQSQYYQQKIQQVTCVTSSNVKKNENQCFGALVQNNKRTQCIQKTRKHRLVVYDREKQKMEEIDGIINVDCICDATDAY
ncbi:uncharacterized protein LOC134664790 [Cydia fagiglandana]|uniref:uncharacterized protein LOC134664790 n=1 Tax=Cydia fagiglandana TaxID=1458189 RepID=UPI002FEDE863